MGINKSGLWITVVPAVLALGGAIYGDSAAERPAAPAVKRKPITYVQPTKENYLK